MRRWHAVPFALLSGLMAAQPASAQPADIAGFSAQLAGDWVDPRVHRCGIVWVRIAVQAGAIQHFTVTYGNAVPGMTGEILEIGEDGAARIYNPTLGFEQRVRFVTPDAHVLERADGVGGVTFVRCPGNDHAPGS
ncbi:MAG: hypothetical protein AAGC57_03540 [Pseudomonadota bacterium]